MNHVFEELRGRGEKAVHAGQLEEAEACFSQALDWAREHGEPWQIDLGTCNRAAVVIELGRGESELPRLREILLRNANPQNCQLAAYNISRFYELTKNYKKSLFYARIALERAEVLERRDWMASTHNRIGNVLLAESFVDEACQRYETALGLMAEGPSVWRARILDNLGYCRILQRRHDEGYRLLYESLAILRNHGTERYQVSTLLDLSFAHLETGRYTYARRRGTLALRLAEQTGQTDAVKNALYLLGEAANLSGDSEAAREYFTRLHQDFFPEASYLPGFLMTVDIRKLINLHA
ncbi:MAG TPA: tetratricopeptide repeat protein [Thermoanaerobaculia bacterium]